MKTKKKRNRLILCLCSIFVLIASIFSFIPLSKDAHIVKADSVFSDYSFTGSNITSKTTFTNGNFTVNLFDKYDITPGYWFVSNSFIPENTGSAENYFISNYILVDGLDSVYISGNKTIGTSNVFYDADKVPFYRHTQLKGAIPVPDGAVYMRFNTYLSDLEHGDIYVTPGSTAPNMNMDVNYQFDFYNPIIANTETSHLFCNTSLYDSFGYYYRLLPPDPNALLVPPDGVTALWYPYVPPYDDSGLILWPFTTRPFTYYRYDTSTSTYDKSYSFNLYYAFFFDGITNVSTANRYFKSDVVRINLGSYLDYSSYFDYGAT